MAKNSSGFEVTYHDFEYNGYKDDYFFYDVPFDIFCDGIRKYFDDKLVTLDGTDNAIWNTMVELGEDTLQNIFDAMEDWFTEQCRDGAYEEFKEYVEDYLSEE